MAPPRRRRSGRRPRRTRRSLAVLMNEASHGLVAARLDGRRPEPGADPWAVGAALQAARARDGLWTVIDEGARARSPDCRSGRPAAGRRPTPCAPIFAPAGRAARRSRPDALYVNVVGDAAGGARARPRRPADAGSPRTSPAPAGSARLSLIVADANAGARRLYARLRLSPGRLATDGQGRTGKGAAREWLLLVKDLA